jgi:hypothetical protein
LVLLEVHDGIEDTEDGVENELSIGHERMSKISFEMIER